ncbi:alpha/beta hydrolase [Marinicella meishanensis]|uniref:alpha/beta hydrolase n=1 Tax=Marinicella meishanensis TaxID=2873263 RepID=UPI001CBD808B|nr:alpha/beta hydrolase [Marinicella sp. NBU2979]
MRKLVKFTSGLFLNQKCPLWLQRKGLNFLGGYTWLPKAVTVNKTHMAGRPVWWFDPNNQRTSQAVLYFHGGGYGVGSPRSHRDLCAFLALYSGLSVVSLDYRLAPEHPYPAALDDAVAAYQALLAQGFKAEHLALAGDSAGGGLALSLTVRLRDRQLPMPGCLFLISPWLIKSQETNSHRTQLDIDPVINEAWSQQMADHYLPDEAIKQTACLSTHDFSGLPPMLVHVGTDEVLLDDSLLLKQKVAQTGGHVQLITYPELWHVFHFSPSLFQPARTALQQAGQFIDQHLANHQP